jgi:tripartite-type tricarboxylate transporter receptor subunit TctC
MIVPVAPGGGLDAFSRLFARHLAEPLGQPVVVENQSAAGGNLAFEHVARARPDGHTLLWGWDSLAINPALYGRVAYGPLRDFAPVVQVVRAAQVLVVRPDLPVRTLDDFLALTRSRTVTLGTPGNGSIGHLAAELLEARAGAAWTHVPYRGGGPASLDLLAGHIDAMSLTLAAVIDHLRACRMRGVVVTTAARAPTLPEIPTAAESGLPGYEVVSRQGVLAPASTAAAALARLNREINRVFARPDIAERLAAQGVDPVGGPPDTLAHLLREDVARWPDIVRAAGARLD